VQREDRENREERKFASEEGKLLAMKARMAKLLAPRARRAPTVDADALRAKLEKVGDLFSAKPDEARMVLQGFIRRVTMIPTDDGVKWKISLHPSLVMPPVANTSAKPDPDGRAKPTAEQVAPLGADR
jgi:hypothetical protein